MAIVHEEWIGRHAKVVEALNKSLEGMEGVVVNETKHLLTLETPQGEKQIPKKGTKLLIDGEEVECVVVAPEERIKVK